MSNPHNTITYTHKIGDEDITLEAPRRFGSQASLEAYASLLDDEEFVCFSHLLRSRRWSDEEFATRIIPIRPHLEERLA